MDYDNRRLVHDYFATKINDIIRNFHVAVSLNGHYCDNFANFVSVSQRSHDYSRVSFLLTGQSRGICERVSRYSYKCCLVLFFSPDSQELFSCFLKTVALLLYDIRTTFV